MQTEHEPTPGSPAPDAAALFAAARQQHRAGQLAAAQALYRRALGADPDHLGSLYFLGIMAIETGRPAVAIDLIARVSARHEAPDVRYHLALALQAERRLAEAETHYRGAIALKPDYVEAHMNLGNVLAEQGRRSEAAGCYAQVLALDPHSAVAHYNLANMLAGLMRLADAETQFRAAIARDPGFAQAWGNLGNVLRDRGRTAEAVDAYRRALALKPDHAEAHNNLGVIAAARGDLPGAIAHYRRAVAARPGFVEVHNNLGLAFARGGDADAAIPCFRHALALKPGDLDATHQLARVLFAHGRAAEAVALLTAAIDRDGNAETRSLFVLCLRGLTETELEGVRAYVLRAFAEGWAHNGELEGPGVTLVKRGRAMAACIALANAAYIAGTIADLAQLLA